MADPVRRARWRSSRARAAVKPAEVAAFLDGLSHAERVAGDPCRWPDRAAPALRRRRRLTAPLRLADLVPPGARGRSRRCATSARTRCPPSRTSRSASAGRRARTPPRPRELWGFNFQSALAAHRPRLLRGARGRAPRRGAVDYTQVPPSAPPGWPAVRAQRARPLALRVRLHGGPPAARLGARDDRLGGAQRPRARQLVPPLPGAVMEGARPGSRSSCRSTTRPTTSSRCTASSTRRWRDVAAAASSSSTSTTAAATTPASGCSALAKRDPRIRVLRLEPNSGQSAAFEAGFRAVRGEIMRHARRRPAERPGRHPAAPRRARRAPTS